MNLYSLRQHDLDQVFRVERGSLLSVPHRGTPRSIVTSVIKRVDYFVNTEIRLRKQPASWLTPKLSNPALPLFLHLKFSGTYTRIERKEICKQAIKPDRFVDHREMPGAFQ